MDNNNENINDKKIEINKKIPARKYELDRCKITGKIKDTTPICVIQEIAKSLAVDIDHNECKKPTYINKLIKYILTVGINVITENEYEFPNTHGFETTHHKMLASFVSGEKWRLSPLITAFRHLLEYYDTLIPPLPEGNFTIGPKSITNPLSYDACMLYRICEYYNIPTIRETTIEDMSQSVKLLSKDPESVREDLIKTINNMSLGSLIGIYMSNAMKLNKININKTSKKTANYITNNIIENKISFPNINYDNLEIKDLEKAHSNVTIYENILPRVQPQSQEEAIMMAAIVFGINLTECINPYEEYMLFKSLGNRYIPGYDEKFKKRFLTNPEWFNIRRVWTPKIPKMYTNEHLFIFAQAEGYIPPSFDNNTAEQAMHLSRCTPTFYLGRHPDAVKLFTPIELESVYAVNPKLLITYGIVSSSEFVIYKVSELTSCFLEYKVYCNPENLSEQISKVAIRKLKNIINEQLGIIIDNPVIPAINKNNINRRGFEGAINDMINTNVNKSVINQLKPKLITEVQVLYKQLLDSMDMVELYSKIKSINSDKMVLLYRKSDENIKENIKQCFIDLLHIGYYMRGWKVGNNNADPIRSEQTGSDDDMATLIELNVTKAIAEFENNCNKLPEDIRKCFETLPLIKVNKRDNEVEFIMSNDKNKGLTVMDRIKIVKTNRADDVNACIRISSNYMCGSAYYYMGCIGLPPPFDIKEIMDVQ
jgi:hypothetical protein